MWGQGKDDVDRWARAVGHGVVALVGRGTEDSVGEERSDGFTPDCWDKPSVLQLLHRKGWMRSFRMKGRFQHEMASLPLWSLPLFLLPVVLCDKS